MSLPEGWVDTPPDLSIEHFQPPTETARADFEGACGQLEALAGEERDRIVFLPLQIGDGTLDVTVRQTREVPQGTGDIDEGGRIWFRYNVGEACASFSGFGQQPPTSKQLIGNMLDAHIQTADQAEAVWLGAVWREAQKGGAEAYASTGHLVDASPYLEQTYVTRNFSEIYNDGTRVTLWSHDTDGARHPLYERYIIEVTQRGQRHTYTRRVNGDETLTSVPDVGPCISNPSVLDPNGWHLNGQTDEQLHEQRLREHQAGVGCPTEASLRQFTHLVTQAMASGPVAKQQAS